MKVGIVLISSEKVKELRLITNCGIMACKDALVEAGGDKDLAVKILREKGLATAEKKSGRIAVEGVVCAKVSESFGCILEVNSETDFAARNSCFENFVLKVLNCIIEKKPSNLDSLLNLSYENGRTIFESLTELISKVGENIVVRRFKVFEGINDFYIHGEGRLGVLINFDLDDVEKSKIQKFKEFSKNICMQVVASNPLYIKKEDVPHEILENEKKILKNQALNEGKSEAIVEKMLNGRVQKYYKEICLLEQPYIKNQTESVFQYIEEVSKKIGTKIYIKSFARFEKGEKF
ncbi:MAG: translation elongation factor Ts [Clostridiales bacterium]|nr:translation elongation factor Ts [Clostridiales bacterium]